MPEVKTHQEIWGRPFPVGGEWDAGLVPANGLPKLGRVVVRRELGGFVVFYHSFRGGEDYVLGEYPPTEEGEREAKKYALSLLFERR